MCGRGLVLATPSPGQTSLSKREILSTAKSASGGNRGDHFICFSSLGVTVLPCLMSSVSYILSIKKYLIS